MYRALIFVGIITLSSCRPETQSLIQQQQQQTTDKPGRLEDCPDLESKHPFNATAYFHDVWYVVSNFYPHKPSNKTEDTICIKFTSQILDNGHVKQHYVQLMGKRTDLHSKSTTKIDEFQNGKYVAQLVDEEGKQLEPVHPVKITIIDTDYSNYALEHTCLPLHKGVLNVYQILNRKPHILDPNVEHILTKLKLKLQDFTAMNQPGCEEA